MGWFKGTLYRSNVIIVDSVEYEYVNDVTCGKFMGRELQNFITGDYFSFFYQILPDLLFPTYVEYFFSST